MRLDSAIKSNTIPQRALIQKLELHVKADWFNSG